MKKKIGVFFGSRSPEHDVSIITAQLIIAGLRKAGHEVVPVYITKKGEWFLGEDLGYLTTFTDPKRSLDAKQFSAYDLELPKSRGKMVFKKRSVLSREVAVDVAFPSLHGSFGEDGTMQGLFEMFNVPYVGCNVISSALTMDKALTKFIYQANNIPTTKFVSFKKNDWVKSKAEQIEKTKKALSWPVLIKPARLGSSIGMTKAINNKELELAVEVALHYDDKVVVEEFIEDLMDITAAVIGNDEPQVSLLQESFFEKNDFFSYEDKYLKEGGTQLGKAQKNIFIPARLDIKTTKEIQNLAVDIFRLLECSGIARVDFLYDKSRKKYFANEVNTLPGTLYHHLWEKSGLALEDLLNRLIEFALEKYAQKQKLTYSFESDLLRQAGAQKGKLVK